MIKFYSAVIVVGLLILPFLGQAQEVKNSDASVEKIKTIAREIMTNATSCALVTTDQEGIARVRAMEPFLPEADFTVWFGTNKLSRKVKHIKQNQNVTLYYIVPDLSGYVTLHGRAQIVDDSDSKKKWWKESWEDFYPNNREDFILIKVIAKSMEILSTKHDLTSNTKGWQVPVLTFESK